MTESRRCKILYLPVRSIIEVFRNWRQHDTINLPQLSGAVPDGYEVRRVAFDFERDSVAVLIEHPSFPETEPGAVYPAINAPWHTETIDLRQMTEAELMGQAQTDAVMLEAFAADRKATIAIAHAVAADMAREVDEDMQQFAKPAKRPWEFLGPPR